MATPVVLSNDDIANRLGVNSQWELKDNKLYRRLMFEDFIHAFGFMAQIAMVAEKINHHPEWANVYRTVDIYLTTHDAGGVSEKDFELLAKIEQLIGQP
ncbi:putative pterin-4a-carbinolamine dehydratase [marine gamma proteobacterium HTCC2143]|jgi:4a-hydroxytetrahydrobiopterin dehydratase|uniref:Putative pterin-4-alpha-carbinolamine dehydratase n=1 Tax=marine gamma proteobacterium HTCC2143 TaxID=247633 RepID=A0YGS1_9GAMM|nr:putative pterin-4a-carbinolamine dehydratase [marine gamma proteobacterium HTCC2143]